MKFFIQDDNGIVRPVLGDEGRQLIVRPDHDEKLFSVMGSYSEYKADLNVPAASASIVFTAVPAGEVWVINYFNIRPYQTNASVIIFRIFNGSGLVEFRRTATWTAGEPIEFKNQIILFPTEYLSLRYNDPSLNDDFVASAIGYKMKAP